MKPNSVRVGEIFTTRHGDLIVEKYINANEVVVRFLSTNSVKITSSGNIRKGLVKDLCAPTVFGVGCIGVGKYLSSSRRVKSSAYICWHNMIKRCYCKEYQEKYPWYSECTVSEEWLNFQNFAEWYYANFKEGFELDKDIKRFGNKVYSKETCQFVPPSINRSHKSAYTLRTRGKKTNFLVGG